LTIEERRPRVARAELRNLMLDAGRSILLEQGLRIRTSSLTFKDARERVEADTGIRFTNASFIGRLWADQEEYRQDVLMSIASDDFRSEIDPVALAVVDVLGRSDLSTEAGRTMAMREICRVGGAVHVDALRRSNGWSLWIGIWSIAASSDDPVERARLQDALRDGYAVLNQGFEDAFGGLMLLLGLRVREPLTVRQFSNAVGALVEGCSLRELIQGEMEGILRPTGPDGKDQEWTVFAIGLAALAQEFFEPVPMPGR
jgi:hypothetical protein